MGFRVTFVHIQAKLSQEKLPQDTTTLMLQTQDLKRYEIKWMVF